MATIQIPSNDATSPFSFGVSSSSTPTAYRATLAYFNAVIENLASNVFVFRTEGVGNITIRATDGDTTDLEVSVENLDTETTDNFSGTGFDIIIPFVLNTVGYRVTLHNLTGVTKGYIVEIESSTANQLYDVGINVHIPAGVLDSGWFEGPDFIEGEIRLYLESTQEGIATVYADDVGSSSGVLFTTAGITPGNIAVLSITETNATIAAVANFKAVRDGTNLATGQLGTN